MSRRSHTTELGCIACEELTELGAGKEGWLVDNPSLLCALNTHAVALANRSLVLVLGWSDPGSPRVKIHPELSPIEAEYVSAIEWLVFDEIRVIAIGTSRGYLLIYSLDDRTHCANIKVKSARKEKIYGRRCFSGRDLCCYAWCDCTF